MSSDMLVLLVFLVLAQVTDRSALHIPVPPPRARLELTLRCPPVGCKYMGRDPSLGTYEAHRYKVDGNEIIIFVSKTALSLSVDCFGAGILESDALPHIVHALPWHTVSLERCPLPAKGSLNDTLTALNVTLESIPLALSLFQLPPTPSLTARHFIGLEQLTSLSLLGKNTDRATPELEFLAPLQNLRKLHIWDIVLPNAVIQSLPPLLEKLEFRNVNVEQLPEALYSSTILNSLYVKSTCALQGVHVGPAVRKLTLYSPATTLRLVDMPALERLDLANWTETQPALLERCGKLHTLLLTTPAVTALPNGWLANCSNLSSLKLRYALYLTSLKQELLINASALQGLAFNQGALETVPEKLLQNAPNLRTLELDGNPLLTLSSSMFLPPGLQVLNLSSINLSSSTVGALHSLEHLTILDLGNNTRLGDLCNETSYSPMRKLTNLRTLVLKETGVTRLCKDWRINMSQLVTLDLRRSKVTVLSFEELQFTRSVKADVLLQGAPVSVVEMTSEQFDKLLLKDHQVTSNIDVRLDAELSCDCRMYWTRRALEHAGAALAHVSELLCRGGRGLRDVRTEDMTCASEEECSPLTPLPSTCTCWWRPEYQPTADRRVVRVRCEGAALRTIPHLQNSMPPSHLRSYELLLANNNISELHADDLQDDIIELDLRNNSLKRVDQETVERLGRVRGLLQLAGNPLECDCSAAPLLSMLHRRAANTTDLHIAICADGRALNNASMVACALAPEKGNRFVVGFGVGLTVLFVLVLVVVVCLATRERRFFVRAVLHRWGVELRSSEPTVDETRPYDAYVTFSHADEAVAREVVARLEPRYRLCVLYRDWVPGRLITSQIAESVEQSRRTVALVSRHFLASTWARAEFREAHAAALRDSNSHRLVVVLLEEPGTLPLDAQLRSYIRTNTYLRWGDAWFWDKLRVALPPPRPPSDDQSDNAWDVNIAIRS